MRLGPSQPLCMTERDAELWWEADGRAWKIGGSPKSHVTSPCDDCNRSFAESMRAVNLCNGLYPGEEPEPMAPSQHWQGYATEEERIAARRASWRRANQVRRALQAAT